MRKATRKKATRKAAPRKTTRKVAAKRKTVRKKVGRPGVKPWSAAEISMLKKAYKTTTATAIARKLRRTVSSVKAKIRVLGVSKPKSARKAAPKRKVRRKATARKPVARKASRKAAPKRKKTAAKRKPARKRR